MWTRAWPNSAPAYLEYCSEKVGKFNCWQNLKVVEAYFLKIALGRKLDLFFVKEFSTEGWEEGWDGSPQPQKYSVTYQVSWVWFFSMDKKNKDAYISDI